jgi:hypothetical protein
MRTIRWFLVVSGLVVEGLLLGAPPKASGQIARRRVIVVDPFFHHYYPWDIRTVIRLMGIRRTTTAK